jgi:hypothetical protein
VTGMRLWLRLHSSLCVSHWLYPVVRVWLESLHVRVDLLGGKRRPIDHPMVVHVRGRMRKGRPAMMMVRTVVIHR